MKHGQVLTLLGFPLIKITQTKYQEMVMNRVILLKTFMVGIGYSTLAGDSILIVLGITKLELFTSFTIRKGWFI